MSRRTLIYLLLVAVSSLMFAGCGEYTRMSLNDVLSSNHKRIIEATTTNGENIVFDTAGAKYLSDSKSVLGITDDGTRALKSTSDLERVTLVDTTGEDSLPLVLPAGQIAAHFAQKRFDRISALLTKRGETYQFNRFGATIDCPNKTINGTTFEYLQNSRHRLTPGVSTDQTNNVYGGNSFASSAVVVPFDSVDCVEVHHPRDTKILKGLLIAGAVAVIVYGISATHPNDDRGFHFDGWDYDPYY